MTASRPRAAPTRADVADCSVIIPTRGRSHLLAHSLASVARQTLPPQEVIVVIDGPDPESAALAAEAGAVIVQNAERTGAGAARNEGIGHATSTWVAFCDDDDLWHPRRLEVTFDYLAAHPECEAVNGPFWVFGVSHDLEPVDIVATDLDGCLAALPKNDVQRDLSYLNITGRSFDLLLERNRGAIATATVRRQVLERAGRFPTGDVAAEDWVMFLNVARYAEWHVLPARTAFLRVHSANNTRSNPSNGLATLRAITEVWRDTRPAPPHRPLAEFGPHYRWLAQQALWAALRARRTALARDVWRASGPLLPRRRDRVYALTPPPLTWRLERLGTRLARGSSARPAT